MRQRRPKGMMFVSYAHVDRQRAEPFVEMLAARFDGRKELLPLERGLSKAMSSLQRIESSLGFVSRTPKYKPTNGRKA